MLHQSMLAALCHPADRSTINGKNKRMVTNIPAPMSLAGHGTLQGAGYIEMTRIPTFFTGHLLGIQWLVSLCF